MSTLAIGAGTELERQVNDYLVACRVEGKTERTIQAYSETLRQFLVYVRVDNLPGTARKFTPADIYRFLDRVRRRGVSIGTRHRRHRETRAFFNWCVRVGECRTNPFDRIPNVRPEQKVIRPFTEDEIQRLLAICDPGTETGIRNRAIILTLLDTGIRAAELHRLELRDLDLAVRRIHIRHGKGRKQRVVSFGEQPYEMLRAYIERYRGQKAGALFQTIQYQGHHRKPMNFYNLGTIMRRLGQKADVKANPHRFRHTFATWAIENSARELDVQYLLGHSTPVMTRRYAATYDAAKAAERHVEFSPADRIRL